MVRDVGRGVPDRHDGVADELVDIAARGLDDPRAAVEILVQHLHQLPLRDLGREPGEAREVGEHHGHLARLAADLGQAALIDHPFDERRREIPAELAADGAGLPVEQRDARRPADREGGGRRQHRVGRGQQDAELEHQRAAREDAKRQQHDARDRPSEVPEQGEPGGECGGQPGQQKPERLVQKSRRPAGQHCVGRRGVQEHARHRVPDLAAIACRRQRARIVRRDGGGGGGRDVRHEVIGALQTVLARERRADEDHAVAEVLGQPCRIGATQHIDELGIGNRVERPRRYDINELGRLDPGAAQRQRRKRRQLGSIGRRQAEAHAADDVAGAERRLDQTELGGARDLQKAAGRQDRARPPEDDATLAPFVVKQPEEIAIVVLQRGFAVDRQACRVEIEDEIEGDRARAGPERPCRERGPDRREQRPGKIGKLRGGETAVPERYDGDLLALQRPGAEGERTNGRGRVDDPALDNVALWQRPRNGRGHGAREQGDGDLPGDPPARAQRLQFPLSTVMPWGSPVTWMRAAYCCAPGPFRTTT